MKLKLVIALCLWVVACLFSTPLQAAKIKRLKFNSEEEAEGYLTVHYNLGCRYYNKQEWRHAANEFEKVIYFFPCSDAAAEAAYYLAVCYFEMKEYDFANREFSNYLKASQHPAFFEDAVYYKFCIAEHFKAGKKKRPFEMRYLPKWVSAHELALSIYDEVVIALPHHELTIQALYSKADLLKKMEEYRECVETYYILIRRFPKHEIVPICYLEIANAYYLQSRNEFQNPDILALAELNVRKFKDDFPRDERVALAEQSVCRIKELYAKGLCDLGLFYERMKQPQAAVIYYQASIEEFPDTHVAEFCRSRLVYLGYAKTEEDDTCTEPTSSSEGSPLGEDSSLIEKSEPDFCGEGQEEVFMVKAPPSPLANDIIVPADIPPYEEYYHYSLMKKRQVSHTPFEPVDEQGPEECYWEGNMPQRYIDDPRLEEDAPFIPHYSQLKRRDQK